MGIQLILLFIYLFIYTDVHFIAVNRQKKHGFSFVLFLIQQQIKQITFLIVFYVIQGFPKHQIIVKDFIYLQLLFYLFTSL